jgi:perosamine synthetase
MTLLSAPNIAGNEWKYVKDCLDTGWVSSVGSYVDSFEKKLAEFTGAKYAVATSSGTTALHISLLLAGVKHGDYVIVPNITFVASLNSIAYTGAEPILMDVNVDDWQMDLDLLEKYLSENTFRDDNGLCLHKSDRRVIRAIMPVHVLGNMCDIEKLIEIALRHGITVVEDSTESLGSYYKGKHSGTFGQFGCISFNGNKIITCGGGGMILTDNEELAKKAKHITTQAKSDPFEYFHDEIGYNYRLVNVLAAIGVAQMEQLPSFLERKEQVASFYQQNLSGIGDICFQSVSKDSKVNNWLFTIKSKEQKKLLKELNAAKLQSRPFWVPMNQLPMFSTAKFITKDNVSTELYNTCLSIPCSTSISNQELLQVTDLIKSVF